MWISSSVHSHDCVGMGPEAGIMSAWEWKAGIMRAWGNGKLGL